MKYVLIAFLICGCSSVPTERKPTAEENTPVKRDARLCLQSILAGLMGAGFYNGVCNENEYTKDDGL